ncbi:GNAT family N-acetyltransferase [Bacillus sp. Bva_UNVM-123]|uniref:N-acetyltransferase family protein n=1 Tax=Bacillus sp. Bva_UNVM-123 TaxID=2829798 RepID=UPI00391F4B1B
MLIREIQLEDAEKFVNLVKQVEEEAQFMMMEPGERMLSADVQRKRIEQMKNEPNSTVLLAEQDGNLVGYLIVVGGSGKRILHRGYLVIGILKEYRGQGIGSKLFQRLDEWAKTHHISRLELTVVTKNEIAVALYKKSGFEIEGTKRNSLSIDNEYYDEYYMAKLL